MRLKILFYITTDEGNEDSGGSEGNGDEVDNNGDGMNHDAFYGDYCVDQPHKQQYPQLPLLQQLLRDQPIERDDHMHHKLSDSSPS